MRLQAFSVQDYRSIREAARIPVRADLTVLVGPNNEGKSNLLRALDLAVNTLEAIAASQANGRLQLHQEKGGKRVRLRYVFQSPDARYDWERDYPRDLQPKKPDGETVVRLTFSLTKEDEDACCLATGHKVSGLLPVEVSYSPGGVFFKVPKQRWSAELSRQAGPICEFLHSRMRLEYIPAVRTHHTAARVIDQILATRLSELEHRQDYRDALQVIEDLQRPVLDSLSEDLTRTLQQFLPAVNAVHVEISPDRRYERMRSASEVVVDDGVATSLQMKGDGVVSLAAISLIRQAAGSSTKRHLVLAIEEPEVHLHPRGVHLLREVLHDLAAPQQVILTTHSPLFAERRTPSANVIVEKNRARAAKTIQEVRECLGVKAMDNLLNAEVVLLVEGPDDRIIVEALLRDYSTTLAEALDEGTLAVQPLDGCGKLPAAIYALEHSVVEWHCLLDFDKDGRDALQSLLDRRLARTSQATFTRLGSQGDVEIEDWVRQDVYRPIIDQEFGPVLGSRAFTNARGKWTKRMLAGFAAMGLDWKLSEFKAKRLVAEAVAASPAGALRKDAVAPFQALADRLLASLR